MRKGVSKLPLSPEDAALVRAAREQRLEREAELRRLKYNNKTWRDCVTGEARPAPAPRDARRDPARRDPIWNGDDTRPVRVTPWEWCSEEARLAALEARRDVINARARLRNAACDPVKGAEWRRALEDARLDPSTAPPRANPGTPPVNPFRPRRFGRVVECE